MAEVWKAYDTQLERYVAIKLLHPDLRTDPEFLTRFTREARVIASLHHPNIVKILDFQTVQSTEAGSPEAAMIMDYVPRFRPKKPLFDASPRRLRGDYWPVVGESHSTHRAPWGVSVASERAAPLCPTP
jgi:serine/threonine protein kinase